jgi:hypothetical protein
MTDSKRTTRTWKRNYEHYTQWALKYMMNLGLCFFLPRCSHTWELAPALEHRAEFPQFLNQRQLVGLLGRVISSSQGLYLYTNTEKRKHIHKH